MFNTIDISAAEMSACEVESTKIPIIGLVQAAIGTVSVNGRGGPTYNLANGQPVFQGDIIETGAGSKVTIAFIDGTVFELAADSHLSLQDFNHAPDGSLSSALVNVARGAFAIIKGNSRGGQGFWVDTPFATIRGTASRYGTGVVTFAALTFAILEKIQAAPWDREPEDDVLPWQDVKHGAYEIVTKGPIPQVTTVEDVTQTIVVRPFGSSFAISTSRNSPSQMAEMLAAAQNAINTYRMGQQDPFTLQQRADLQDIQPGSRGSAGSSTLFVEARIQRQSNLFR